MIPTSITTAPSFTHSPFTIRGCLMATTSMSACLTSWGRSFVREWQTVTVAWCQRSKSEMGHPCNKVEGRKEGGGRREEGGGRREGEEEGGRREEGGGRREEGGGRRGRMEEGREEGGGRRGRMEEGKGTGRKKEGGERGEEGEERGEWRE